MMDVLRDRELRAENRERLTAEYGLPILVMRVNYPGALKKTDASEKIYRIIKVQLEYLLDGFLKYQEDFENADGGAFFAVLDKIEGKALKGFAVELEEKHLLGRCVDIDVIDSEGVTLSRRDLDLPVRKCYVCEEEAHICVRNKTHDLLELEGFIQSRLKAYEGLLETRARRIAKLATKAMMYEVSATPKPGLVDRYNSGAHRDMDFFTFIDSSAELIHFFSDCAVAVSGVSIGDILGVIRPLGIKAEKDMFSATNGVNTQKGMIFSLGLLSAAASVVVMNAVDLKTELIKQERQRFVYDLSEVSAKIVETTVIEELDAVVMPKSYGEKQYRQFGFRGARGEAHSGFKSVLEHGIPMFEMAVNNYGLSLNDAMVATLMNLIPNVVDSNVIGRWGVEVLEASQCQARDILSHGFDDLETFKSHVQAYDQWCIANHVSHGGASDLLAVTLFMVFLEDHLAMRI